MRNYQLVLVLKKSLTEVNRKKLLDSVKEMLKGVKFTKEEDWGEKPLSYVINREESAYFVNWLFETKEVLESDLERKLINNEDVLRHLLLRVK